MRAGFYPKLAFDGIRKNKRMYIPYILTCVGMVMMYYIVSFLQFSDKIAWIKGTDTVRSTLTFGTWVIAIFAVIFLFYTNSFLIRRRKKEFGLYNILGMGKRNIGFILVWETIIVAVISLVAGIVLGFAFSKLAELGLVNMLQADVDFTLSVSFDAIGMTLIVFAVIFLLLFLNSLRQIKFASAVSLLKSENVGEKPPKGNWFFGILGVLILAAAYVLVISIADPIAALVFFFLAVIMVIVGTYLIMISGSVLFCRILQKRKGYYYKPNHFVSISSMVYRMKRNGAGLASICILATMVLVMISSTATLFFGTEDSINSRYPRDINMDYRFAEASDMNDENIDILRSNITKISEECGVKSDNISEQRSASISGVLDGNKVECNSAYISYTSGLTNLWQFVFVPLADYNSAMNTNETLEDDEVLIYSPKVEYTEDTLSFNRACTLKVKKRIDEFYKTNEAALLNISSMVIVVPDIIKTAESFDEFTFENGEKYLNIRWQYNFDVDADEEKQLELIDKFNNDYLDNGGSSIFEQRYIECREENRDYVIGTNGGFLYLGIILSIVFVFAAVLIIYYKQISEGYEDQSRFEIMQKVGMTKQEIRKSINSQLLTVFFLPLILAGIHLAFAFPIIQKVLVLFSIYNVGLFALTTVICFLAYALIYIIVYKITSNAYYNIVSGVKDKV